MPKKSNQRGAPTMKAPLDSETRDLLVKIEQRQTCIEQLLNDLSKQMVVMMESFEQMKASCHTPISDSIPKSPIEEFVAADETNDCADDHGNGVYHDDEELSPDHAAVVDDHATPADETEPVKEKRAVRTNRKYKNEDYVNLGFHRIHQRK